MLVYMKTAKNTLSSHSRVAQITASLPNIIKTLKMEETAKLVKKKFDSDQGAERHCTQPESP